MTTDVVTAGVDTPIPRLVEDMITPGVSGLPVVDADRQVVGVVSEADLVARRAYSGPRGRLLTMFEELLRSQENRWWHKARGLNAGDIMSVPPRTAAPTDPLRAVAARMVSLAIKRLPVVDAGGHLIGIVSQRDLLRLFHRTDDEIREATRATLADPLRCPEDHGVAAAVESGVVTLSGWARTAMDVELIETMVRDVPGVVDVCDDVVVKQPDPTPRGARVRE